MTSLYERLSFNPAAIHLLEANLDKVNWEWLSTNQGLFKEEYYYLIK